MNGALTHCNEVARFGLAPGEGNLRGEAMRIISMLTLATFAALLGVLALIALRSL